MAGSLLAHLYPRIHGSQEDVATLSLNYIIHRTGSMRRMNWILFWEMIKL